MTPPKMTVETVKKIAELGNWDLTDEQAEEIAGIFEPLYDDTRVLRQMDLGDSVPDSVFQAD